MNNKEFFELEKKAAHMYNSYADYYRIFDARDDISTEDMDVMLWIVAMRLEKEYGVPFDRDYLPKVESIIKLSAWYMARSDDACL